MKSQIQKKKDYNNNKKEWWNCGITKIFPKKASHEGTKTFFGKKNYGEVDAKVWEEFHK